MFRITILLSGKSGRGSNMAALHAACVSGDIPAEITDVIGTHPASPALARADSLGIATHCISSKNDEFEMRLLDTLFEAKPDLICLAGFMRKLPQSVLARFPNRIVNIHPALLPSFGGKGMFGHHIHVAVLAHGCKVSGCTVHFVDEEFDTGPIIVQECVEVMEEDTVDTLAERVLHAEHQAYPRAVRLIAEGWARVDGRRVVIGPELQRE